jgi:hypothetical protein
MSPTNERFQGGNMHTSFRRAVAATLVVCVTVAAIPRPAQAEMLRTDAYWTPERVRVMATLQRPEVRAELQKFGADPAQVDARVAALSDEEVAELAGRVDQAAAGGFIQVIAMFFYVAIYGVALVATGVAAVIRAIARSSPTPDHVAAKAPPYSEASSTPESVSADTWTYSHTTPKGRHLQSAIRQVTIVSGTSHVFVDQGGHPKGRYLMGRGDVSLLSDGARAAKIENLDPDCPANQVCSARAWVAGKERVSVPAGEFEATKVIVEYAWMPRGPGGDSGARTLTIWYSPLVKRAVKFSSRGTRSEYFETDFDLELQSYGLSAS